MITKNRSLLKAVVMVFVLVLVAVNAAGQNSSKREKSKESPLNKIRIGACDVGNLEQLIVAERRRGLVLDVRPFAINQSTGKLQFNGETGHVSVVNMNPFVYRYDISVDQQELVSSALSDFIDILLPPGLREVGRTQSGLVEGANVPAQLDAIEKRLATFSTANCANVNDPGCVALKAMHDQFLRIKNEISTSFNVVKGPPDEVINFQTILEQVRDVQADAITTCIRATNLHNSITTDVLNKHLDALEAAKNKNVLITGLANDLSQLVTEFTEDDGLKDYVVRCAGFNCLGQFEAYAQAVLSVLQVYEQKLTEMQDTATKVRKVYDLTTKWKTTDGVFARSFEIIKRFELSEATISIARTRVDKQPDQEEAQNGRIGAPPRTNPRTNPTPAATGRPVTHHNMEAENVTSNVGANLAANGGSDSDDEKKAENNGNLTPADDPRPLNQSIQIGRPRFLVSGGLVYSPLQRQTFVAASGFVRDANGNPTGEGNKQVVSFEENSPRRLLPMVMLNTRIASFKPASFYFSLGVTAKKDKDIDVEYLIGPSVSMLNDRAMFTFGAYAGKTQNLVPDVKIGDEIPDSAGDASFFTKRYSWKPGFSFTYVFSNVNRRPTEAGSGVAANGSSTPRDDVSEEIRIGSVPFNLAMGLAYTSVEDRTFHPVLGFARDRQGNLTNGQTLTRTVGLATSSGYRLVPLAMLHSRLINFGRHSFYLTSGVTGKKTDDNIEIEYLVGGSVNIYRRKVFLTFGAFAGKQQVLGGDLFLGGMLDPSQTVTTHSRYVWKPAFALSYDISRIMPRSTKE